MQGEARRRLAARLREAIVSAAREAAPLPQAGQEVDKDQRRRTMREIRRISDRYGWGVVVETALDQLRVPALRHLDDSQLQALASFLHRTVDNAMTVCDLEDDLPAR